MASPVHRAAKPGAPPARREGARVHYRPAGDDVLSLWLSLRGVVGARNGDVERAARDHLGGEVELGNTVVTALSTPGHAPAHAAYGPARPGRLGGDGARPAGLPETAARAARRRVGLSQPLRRLGLRAGPVGQPFSTIGFERRHNAALAHADADAFAAALLAALPSAPADQEAIVAVAAPA
jgi:hypothetical protein